MMSLPASAPARLSAEPALSVGPDEPMVAPLVAAVTEIAPVARSPTSSRAVRVPALTAPAVARRAMSTALADATVTEAPMPLRSSPATTVPPARAPPWASRATSSPAVKVWPAKAMPGAVIDRSPVVAVTGPVMVRATLSTKLKSVPAVKAARLETALVAELRLVEPLELPVRVAAAICPPVWLIEPAKASSATVPAAVRLAARIRLPPSTRSERLPVPELT